MQRPFKMEWRAHLHTSVAVPSGYVPTSAIGQPVTPAFCPEHVCPLIWARQGPRPASAVQRSQVTRQCSP